MATPELPANAATFTFTPSRRWLMVGCLVGLCGFVAFGLAVALTGRGTRNLVIAATSVVVFGSITLMTLFIVRRMWDRVAVSDEGIWYLPRRGAPTFIGWDEVGSVEAHDLIKRLVIRDYAHLKQINLEYQLDRFEELRSIVLARTVKQRRARLVSSVFHRGFVSRGILFPSLLMFAIFAAWSPHTGNVGTAAGFVGFAALTLYTLVREQSRVTVAADSIEIEYLGWRRVLRFDSVTNIEIVNLPSGRGDVSAVVIIDIADAQPLRLAGFKEGSVALYDGLRSGWDAARGGNPTAPKQFEERDGERVKGRR